MQGTFLPTAASIQRSRGLWSSVGLCSTLWITVLQVAPRGFSQWSHIAFTLICFIFICFFSSFFCSRRKAASCRQGQRSEWTWVISSKRKLIFSEEPNRKTSSGIHISTHVSSSLGASTCSSCIDPECHLPSPSENPELATAAVPTGSPGGIVGETCQELVNLKMHLTSSRRCFSGSSSFMIRSFSARFFSSRRDWAASCLCTWVSLRKFSSTRALFLSAFCLPFSQ